MIDGLTESGPEAICLVSQCFKSVDIQSRPKILLLRRPTTDITMRVKQLALNCTIHQISALDTYDDIKLYLEDVFEIIILTKVAINQWVVEKSPNKASNNFLWVSSATKDLEKS